MQSPERGGYGLGGIALGIREKCLADPLYLAKHVIGGERDDRDFTDAGCPYYRQVADSLVKQEDLLLILPRNHGKTTIVDEVGSIWQLLKYPNDRILFAQASLDNAKALARQVRQHLMANQILKAIFPEYTMKTSEEEGNIMSFSVPCRTSFSREASLEIGTPDTNLSGRHYDVIRTSDIVNEQTVPPPSGKGTVEMMQKIISWYGTTAVLLDTTNPRAHRTVDGTRWADGDLYGELINTDLGKSFRKIVVGIKNDEAGNPISIWNKMSSETLLKIKSGMSSYLWSANMANDPLPSDGIATFRKEWFRQYETAPDNLYIAITVDPAFSDQAKNANADRSAIIVSGVAPDGNLYVLVARAGRWTPRALLENLHALIEQWNPSWVGIETGGQQYALIDMFREDQSRTGRYVPFRELKTHGKNKMVRAMALQSHAERFGIWVRPEHQDMVDEFLRFPVGKHDDFVDALAYRGQDLLIPAMIYEGVIKRPSRVLGNDPLTGADIIGYLEDPEAENPKLTNTWS